MRGGGRCRGYGCVVPKVDECEDSDTRSRRGRRSRRRRKVSGRKTSREKKKRKEASPLSHIQECPFIDRFLVCGVLFF